MSGQVGKVYLVGAGPGAPDSITLRAAAVMRRAEVVVHDSLVSPEVVALAPADAELIFAGKRGGVGREFEQEEINRILVDCSRAGKITVRLKGGGGFPVQWPAVGQIRLISLSRSRRAAFGKDSSAWRRRPRAGRASGCPTTSAPAFPEVVVHDSLVSPKGVVALAPADAELIFAGKRGGVGRELEQGNKPDPGRSARHVRR